MQTSNGHFKLQRSEGLRVAYIQRSAPRTVHSRMVKNRGTLNATAMPFNNRRIYPSLWASPQGVSVALDQRVGVFLQWPGRLNSVFYWFFVCPSNLTLTWKMQHRSHSNNYDFRIPIFENPLRSFGFTIWFTNYLSK